MDTLKHFRSFLDRTIMKSHYETYKGWNVQVEIAANSFIDDSDGNMSRYIPRIVATEQQSIGFKELNVPSEAAYPTAERCIQAGIVAARKFIDDRR